MALTLDQFTKQLTDSGLMSADDLAAFTNSLPEDQKPADAEALAKKLVADKKLTPFQAQHIWKGKGKSLVLGDYIISDKIGAGGMGMVFKAHHRLMKRVVALKVLPPSVTKDENATKRFLREVEAAAKLTHPNIVAANDARENNGAFYLIMEYVEGKDLSETVKKQGPATVAQAVDFVLQAARGLEFAHEQGVIHRDIKPANLLLDSKGTVKILDMGLARIEDDSVDAATQAGLTGTGTIMGTVDYMAPEQAMDTKSAGPQADIYSLGASLYYLLLAKPVVSGNTIGKKMHSLMTGIGIPESISVDRPEVPIEVDAIYRKMIAHDLANRYQTMTEVIADLEAIKAGGVPSSASSAGIQPVAASRSEDSAMNSFLGNLGAEASATDQTVIAPVEQQAAQGSDTFAQSSGELTKQRLAPTQMLSAALKGKSLAQRRNLLIGSSVAVVVLLGALIWGFSGGGNEPELTQVISDTSDDTTGSADSTEIEVLKGKTKTVTTDLSEPAEYALQFNKNADVVTVDGLNLSGRDQPFTYEFWLTGREVGNGDEEVKSCIMVVGFASGGAFNVHYFEPSQIISVTTWTGNDRRFLGGTTLTGVSLGSHSEPMHLAIVWDGSQSLLFVEGSLVELIGKKTEKYQEHFAEILSQGDPSIRIGGGIQAEKGEELSAMNLHAVRISSSARYTETFQPPRTFDADDQTVALYKIDEGRGDVLKDSSGNNHHGKITGPKWVRVGSSGRNAPPLAVAPFDEAQAKAHQKAWANYLGEPVEMTNSIGMKFVVIPPGKFKMGEGDNAVDVTLTKPYRIGVHEVTQGQWKGVMGTEPWNDEVRLRGVESFAASYIRWPDARDFCLRLTERERAIGRLSEDQEYILPTEVEWEYACRSGTSTVYSFGDDESKLNEYAWYGLKTKNNEFYARQVGLKKPNQWGLYDMLGNVYEWCSDRYGEKSSDSTNRTSRGGCWYSSENGCTSSHRDTIHMWTRRAAIGFRVAVCRTPKESPPVDPDRAAAEWVLGIGGAIGTDADEEEKLKTIEELPQQPFQVTEVALGRNKQVTNDGLEHLTGLAKINRVGLHNTSIGDAGMIHLKGLLSLREINLRNTRTSDAGLKYLEGLASLKVLYLGMTQVTAAGVADIQKALPDCKITWDGSK